MTYIIAATLPRDLLTFYLLLNKSLDADNGVPCQESRRKMGVSRYSELGSFPLLVQFLVAAVVVCQRRQFVFGGVSLQSAASIVKDGTLTFSLYFDRWSGNFHFNYNLSAGLGRHPVTTQTSCMS
jgi:hypothetical protein